MAASPIVVVQNFSNFLLDPNDATRAVFTVTYDISFVPDENAPPKSRQDEISLSSSNLSKNTVRVAAENRIIAEVANLGATIAAGAIFTVADLI